MSGYEIEYLIESDEMSDSEYETQEFKSINLTSEEFESIIFDWVEQNAKIDYDNGESVCRDNFFIFKK